MNYSIKSLINNLLDLLEVCEADNMKSIAAAEQQFADLNDEFEDDFALVTNEISKKNSRDDNDSDDLISNQSEDENLEDELSNQSDTLDFESEDENIVENSKEKRNKDCYKKKVEKSITSKSKLKNSVDESYNNIRNKKQKLNTANSLEEEEFNHNDSDVDSTINNGENEDERNAVWEDIYGRKRNKQGAVISEVNIFQYSNACKVLLITSFLENRRKICSTSP